MTSRVRVFIRDEFKCSVDLGSHSQGLLEPITIAHQMTSRGRIH